MSVFMFFSLAPPYLTTSSLHVGRFWQWLLQEVISSDRNMLKTFSLFKKQTRFSVSKFAAHMKVGRYFYCELEEHCITESQNVLSWKETTRITQSGSSVNGPHRDQTCDLGIVSPMLLPAELIPGP